MKLLNLLFILITVNLNAQQSRFKEGETLNVWATSGLNMRDKPDAKATKVATVPYGAKVTVQANIGVKIPFEVEEFKGFVVKGYWLLVKYGNREGFVFDGFLSRLPAPSKNDTLGLEGYFDENIGKIGSKYEVRFYDEAVDSVRDARPNEKYDLSKHDGVCFKQKYKNGIELSYSSGEGGGGYTITLPNGTLYEGYYLIKVFYYNKEGDVITFDSKEKSVNLAPKEEGAGCYYDVKQVGHKIVIDGYCGC